MNNLPKFIDLFCGIGGLTHGFIKEGFEAIAGIDYDETCKFAFEKNNNAPFLHQDLTVTHSDDIRNLFEGEKVKILVGCAPCQAFSMLNNKNLQNEKWKLLYSFGRIITDIKPDVISMENVPNLVNFDSGRVFHDFVTTLENAGYSVTYEVINAKHYGVPQNRNRLILIASLHGKVHFLPPTHKEKIVTLREAIGDLPEISQGETHDTDKLHLARRLTPINQRRIAATSEGGSWKEWPDELVLECHKKASGKTYRSVYGRMRWNDVSPTLTTQCTGLGNGRFGHPQQNRAISLREAAILQSFPRNYELIDPNRPQSISNLERHIGNAVPVLLGNFVAKTIKAHLVEYSLWNPNL
jgi:DNA (cytosine-5)-methyltransferase 1